MDGFCLSVELPCLSHDDLLFSGTQDFALLIMLNGQECDTRCTSECDCSPPMLRCMDGNVSGSVIPAHVRACPLQVSLPVASVEEGLPVGLSLIGPKGKDEALLDAAACVAAACGLQ